MDEELSKWKRVMEKNRDDRLIIERLTKENAELKHALRLEHDKVLALTAYLKHSEDTPSELITLTTDAKYLEDPQCSEETKEDR